MTDDLDTFDLSGALPFDADADAITPQKHESTTLGIGFAYIGRGLTVPQFREYVQGYNFGSVPPDYIVLHHTAVPSASWARYPSGAVWDANEFRMSEQAIYEKRERQLDALRSFYEHTRGWDRGPHLFIDERWIWLFTPLFDIGIHAAQGNSYRDSGGKLHYSVGIEVIGYYEHVHWPAAVAANVAGAVAALKQQLGTFDYIDKPWVGGVGSHRMYNKPSCPGAAIVPSYYLPVLRGAGAPTNGTHYRVRMDVTAGATIRTAPRQNAAVLGRLRAGDSWYGEPIEAKDLTFVKGFGSSKTWVRSPDMRFVWAGLLEVV